MLRTSFFELFSDLKEDVRQLYMQYVHQQKDFDFELSEELTQFDNEEFQMTHCIEKIANLRLAKAEYSQDSELSEPQVFNKSLVDLLGSDSAASLNAKIVKLDDSRT